MNQDSDPADGQSTPGAAPSTQTAASQGPPPAAAREPRHVQIGPYKILEVLGEGGMGVVYLAEQSKPIHRRVALKIIKLGMDTKQVIARFETEREALALMNHPNVAKVFDAGATETGRPYFAMEYVAGIPITDYCDKHRLNTEERLRLFMDVCHAVQHAHQKGIIHRDIKPSNVLVAVQDGEPTPKVIDFGVAKATQHRLTERTLFTEQGQLVGTPGYMSPEQAEMTALDIDTRTDIYSLGVLLYELLVGALPFDTETLLQAGFAEVQRIIREVDPPKPSTRLSALGSVPRVSSEPRPLGSGADASADLKSPLPHGRGSAIDDIAKHRHTEPKTLIRQIRGDLDWIVMRGMEKDRTRRYPTPTELATDLVRHLHHEPVIASPPGTIYRMKKFARRNKGPVAAVVAVVLALAVGLVGTGLMYVRVVAERDRAQEAERLTQESLAETEEARNEAEQVTQFLADTLAAVDPSKQGKDVTVREVLDRASEKISRQFANKALLEARLKNTIGSTYFGLGLYDSARAHFADAAAIYLRVLGERDPHTLSAMNGVAVCIGELGKYSASEASHRSTLEIQRRVLGEEHPHTLSSMNNLAAVLTKQGRYPEAEELHRKTLEIQQRVLGAKHPDTLMSMNNLSTVLSNQGRYTEAERLQGKTLEIQQRVLGEEHRETLKSVNDLANVISNQGRYAEAEALYRQALEIQRRVLGEEHSETLVSMNNLANVLSDQGRYAEGEELYRKTLGIVRQTLGKEHPYTLVLMSNLADALLDQGRYAEAEELARKALEVWEKTGEPIHVDRWLTTSVRGGALTGLGRFAEAEPLLVGACEAIKDRGDVPPADKREALHRIVRLYESWDAAEPGKSYAEKAAEWRGKLDELNAETQKRQNTEKSENQGNTEGG
jgi:serine/threonine protein kinase/tetratricopeptide (TPR) repeat protein